MIWTKSYKIGKKTRKLYSGAVVTNSGAVATGEGSPILIFLMDFVEEMDGTLFTVIVFQNLVCACRDLEEKMAKGIFKNIFDLKINLID